MLAFVETVHLIDKHDGLSALGGGHGGLFHGFANVLDATQYRADGDETRVEGVGHQAGNGGFAGSRRAPQDAAMGFSRFERHPQGLPFAHQVLLADHLPKTRRTQALGQGRMQGTLRRSNHNYWRMTSDPAGGLKTKLLAGKTGLTSTRPKVNTER